MRKHRVDASLDHGIGGRILDLVALFLYRPISADRHVRVDLAITWDRVLRGYEIEEVENRDSRGTKTEDGPEDSQSPLSMIPQSFAGLGFVSALTVRSAHDDGGHRHSRDRVRRRCIDPGNRGAIGAAAHPCASPSRDAAGDGHPRGNGLAAASGLAGFEEICWRAWLLLRVLVANRAAPHDLRCRYYLGAMARAIRHFLYLADLQHQAKSLHVAALIAVGANRKASGSLLWRAPR